MSSTYGADAHELAVVARIRRLRRDGYTYRAIAAHLDRKGIKPSRAERWSAATVRLIWLRDQQ